MKAAACLPGNALHREEPVQTVYWEVVSLLFISHSVCGHCYSSNRKLIHVTARRFIYVDHIMYLLDSIGFNYKLQEGKDCLCHSQLPTLPPARCLVHAG